MSGEPTLAELMKQFVCSRNDLSTQQLRRLTGLIQTSSYEGLKEWEVWLYDVRKLAHKHYARIHDRHQAYYLGRVEGLIDLLETRYELLEQERAGVVQPGSLGHKVLEVMRDGRWFSIIKIISRVKEEPAKVRTTIFKLNEQGLIHQSGRRWRLTQNGIERVAYLNAKTST